MADSLIPISDKRTHGAIYRQQLGKAAKSILVPLGCTRIGRSRMWIADQRFWVILIEFRPKGSYLNVGAHWLWCARDYWSFDHGHRIEVFVRFENEAQFAVSAQRLVTRAAEEIAALRKQFASLSDIAREIAPSEYAGAWSLYHAAIATGLLGNTAASAGFFNRLIGQRAVADWHRKLQADGEELARRVSDTTKFCAAIHEIVRKARSLHGMSDDQQDYLDVTGSRHRPALLPE